MGQSKEIGFDLVFLAGEHERPEVPVSVELPVKLDKSKLVKLVSEEDNLEFWGIIAPESGKKSILTTILPALDYRQELETELVINSEAQDVDSLEGDIVSNGVTLSIDTKVNEKLNEMQQNNGTPKNGIQRFETLRTNANPVKIDVSIGGSYFTSFYGNHPETQRPFLYPLIAPCGIGVTRNWPIKKDVSGETSDHIHHKSCWTAWGDINGTDNWADGARKGRQRTDEIVLMESSPVYGRLNLINSWLDKKGKPQLEENRDIIIYNLKDKRVVDFTISLKSLIGDVKFGDTKEGGFLSVRVATPMDGNKGGKIENSIGGINEKETWGKRAEWCDYSGVVDGKKVGVAIFDNVNNYMFPTYWHVRNYGLMTANPFGLSHFLGKKHNGSYLMKSKDSLVFKYRLIVHNGDAQDANLRNEYLNYYIAPEVAIFKH